MARCSWASATTDMTAGPIVIIGAGQAGAWMAMTLRDEGFAGDLMLVGNEGSLPYERPPLSKSVLAGTQASDATTLFDREAFAEKRITLVSDEALAIDANSRAIRFRNGEPLVYDQLIIATGASNRLLVCPGSLLKGVHYLRTRDECAQLRRDLESASHLLVIGGGWIGLEVAATVRGLGKRVTLVESADRLCSRSLPVAASDHLAALHRENAVDLKLGTGVHSLTGTTRVQGAMLTDGSILDCDCVLVGIGAIANDQLASAAGLAVAGGVKVDGFGRTSRQGIFAIGDVAVQDNSHLPGTIRLESWENAQNQAIHCARAMLGLETKAYDPLPWIWSDQYDVNIQIMGFPPAGDDNVVFLPGPGVADGLFAVMRAGHLCGAVGFNRGREIKILRRLCEAGYAVTQDDLRLPPNALAKLTRQAPASADMAPN